MILNVMKEAMVNCPSPCQLLAGSSAPIDWWHPIPIVLIIWAMIGVYAILKLLIELLNRGIN